MAIIRGTKGDDVLRGTRKSDTMYALSGNDKMLGSTGNDTFYGGPGFDTVYYSRKFKKITLRAVGLIDKGRAGTDQIVDVESIYGPRGRKNVIDGTAPGGGPASFDVDLSKHSLKVLNIPGIGTASFKVKNFVHVYGTSNDDRIALAMGSNNGLHAQNSVGSFTTLVDDSSAF